MSSKLIEAARKGNLAVVKKLAVKLNTSGVDKKNRKSGDTALIQAARYGYHLCVQVLVENGADVNRQNFAGYTALFLSVDRGYFECVKILLENGAAINMGTKTGEFGDDTTALMKCCWRNGVEYFYEEHIECARLLVENGANVNCQSSKGYTALNICASFGIPSLVKLLLEHKAALNIQDEFGNTEMILSTVRRPSKRKPLDSLECLKILLAYGGDLNIKNKRGDTALIACVRDVKKHPYERELSFSRSVISHAKFLLDNGADPNTNGYKGDTILILSVQQANLDYIRLLLLEKYETDINVQNNDGDTALICGARRGLFNCLHLLLESGRANMNIQNKFGNTALITSIKSGHYECAKLLIRSGADVAIRNHDGCVAIDLAVSADLHELLKSYTDIPEAEPVGKQMVATVITSAEGGHTEPQYNNEVSRWLLDNGLGFLAYNATYHELNSFEDTGRLSENELFSMLLVKSEKHKNMLRHSPLL